MKSYKEFKKKYLGKSLDYDGYYGYQCWDLYAYYDKYLGYTPCNCNNTGYVIDLGQGNKAMLNNHRIVDVPQQGDIVIFNYGTLQCPYSHIGIIDSINSTNKTINVLGQNQGTDPKHVTIVTLKSNQVNCYYRPKCFSIKVTNKIVKEVIQGVHGNGTERKQNLKALGYTDKQIKQIQQRVNEYYNKG